MEGQAKPIGPRSIPLIGNWTAADYVEATTNHLTVFFSHGLETNAIVTEAGFPVVVPTAENLIGNARREGFAAQSFCTYNHEQEMTYLFSLPFLKPSQIP